jgi:hypothetical protein
VVYIFVSAHLKFLQCYGEERHVINIFERGRRILERVHFLEKRFEFSDGVGNLPDAINKECKSMRVTE